MFRLEKANLNEYFCWRHFPSCIGLGKKTGKTLTPGGSTLANKAGGHGFKSFRILLGLFGPLKTLLCLKTLVLKSTKKECLVSYLVISFSADLSRGRVSAVVTVAANRFDT